MCFDFDFFVLERNMSEFGALFSSAIWMFKSPSE